MIPPVTGSKAPTISEGATERGPEPLWIPVIGVLYSSKLHGNASWRRHISEAQLVSSVRRHVDQLLGDRNLHELEMSLSRDLMQGSLLKGLGGERLARARRRKAMGNLLEMERKYEEKRETYERRKRRKFDVDDKLRLAQVEFDSLKAGVDQLSTLYQKAKVQYRRKHAELCDYRQRIRTVSGTIMRLKADLWDNVVDMFSVSDELYNIQTEIFDHAVEELKAILVASYPGLYFRAFDTKVKKRIEGRVKLVHGPVDDMSLAFTEVILFDDEPSDVSSENERMIEAASGKWDASGKGKGACDV
ncbi:hypothetical protein Ddye_017244 [Dipteronia dyeriana]|uniref:Uncharacterized protein n=1 Tax=Dipteronia dyeriana TaxID=168575 RepID=A0AAD9X1A9_9ROSI|nr:hypothetical protein Ddye_017244 [Dipteronia dyeriana]